MIHLRFLTTVVAAVLAMSAGQAALADDETGRGGRYAQDVPDFGSATPVPSDSDYEITDDGYLIYKGDMVFGCEDLGPEDYASAALYEEQTEICAEAGFATGEALPGTGGPPLLLLAPLALLLGAGMLVRATRPVGSQEAVSNDRTS
jgi:hypothetical protein